jgi:anti-sigma-K factor RskA
MLAHLSVLGLLHPKETATFVPLPAFCCGSTATGSLLEYSSLPRGGSPFHGRS